ncbi:MAG: hypothetical protein ACE5D4_09755 [Thermodesulfobacteriota bacterium]
MCDCEKIDFKKSKDCVRKLLRYIEELEEIMESTLVEEGSETQKKTVK